ncbi:hypothetical protein SAMN04490248_13114 [Salinihabitans flavidus]|uniref:Uncharacterized protein n=1 Tax=Salinihabitans flavidus TaxID=569882 RepID=A0A1H8VMB0_9RHOB|nr:hypothetical protein SAMN04490248_13114 [Salinihabitans flavidus]
MGDRCDEPQAHIVSCSAACQYSESNRNHFIDVAGFLHSTAVCAISKAHPSPWDIPVHQVCDVQCPKRLDVVNNRRRNKTWRDGFQVRDRDRARLLERVCWLPEIAGIDNHGQDRCVQLPVKQLYAPPETDRIARSHAAALRKHKQGASLSKGGSPLIEHLFEGVGSGFPINDDHLRIAKSSRLIHPDFIRTH